nr:hypothetical protein [Candidatus Dependentiae bacterium]
MLLLQFNNKLFILVFLLFIFSATSVFSNSFSQDDWSKGQGQEIWDSSALNYSSKYYYDTNCHTITLNEVKLIWISEDGTTDFPAPVIGSEDEKTTINASGMIAVDGKYLYIKNWYDNNSNDNKLIKIGTGFNSTVEGQDYGYVSDTPLNKSKSMTYISGNYILNGYTLNGSNLERISTITGIKDFITFSDGLIKNNTGLTFSGSSDQVFITSDMIYLYNIANSINNGGSNGFTIKVFKMSDYSYVRTITVPLTDGFSDLSCVYTDGDFVYILEKDNSPEGIRISLTTGLVVDRWQYVSGNHSQNGCYDFENNIFWTAEIQNNPHIFKYPGYDTAPADTVSGTSYFLTEGNLYSSKFYAGESVDFTNLITDSILQNGTNIKLQLRTANTISELDSAAWMGISDTQLYFTGNSNFLNPNFYNKKCIQYHALLETSDTKMTPYLKRVSITYIPTNAEQYHILISNDGYAVRSIPEPVSITIIDSTSGLPVTDFTGSISVYSSGLPANTVWTLISGNGTFDNTVPGKAEYTFSITDNGSAILGYTYSAADTIFFNASGYTSSGRYITENDSARLVVQNLIHYEITSSAPHIKNLPFTYQITAKDTDGTIVNSYNGIADIYVLNGSGTLVPTQISITNGLSGTISAIYNEADSIMIKAVDSSDTTIYGISSLLIFSETSGLILKMEIENSSYYISGKDYKISFYVYDETGSIYSSFNDTVTIYQNDVQYINPVYKNKELQKGGIESSGNISIKLTNGSGTLYFHYDDAGTISFRSRCDSYFLLSDYCTQLQFIPYYIDILLSNVSETSAKEFDMKVTAYSQNSEITSNYKSILEFTPEFIDPVLSDISNSSGLEVKNISINTGQIEFIQKYNESGRIYINAIDNSYSPDTVISGKSAICGFTPSKFSINVTYPVGRTFFYLSELWNNVTINPLNDDSNITENYNRLMLFDQTPAKKPFNLPADYSYVPLTDKGSLEYNNFFFSIDEGLNILKVNDQLNNNIFGSSEIQVLYAQIQMMSVSAQVGTSASVTCRIIDKDSNIISNDNSTAFRILIVRPSSAVSGAETNYITVSNGIGIFSVYD